MKVTLVLFAKLPILGQVKTRIGRSSGDVYALSLYSKLLDQTLLSANDALRELTAQGIDAELHWCFSGDWACCSNHPSKLVAQFYRSPHTRFAQLESHDLGQRMHASLFTHTGVRLLFGSDIPDLSAARIAASARQLIDADPETWLINPTHDGGYCMIGTNTRAQSAFEFFENIEWSTPQVMLTTRRRFQERGLRLIELTPLADVDTLADAEAYLNATGFA
jgi:uncharacterized protein